MREPSPGVGPVVLTRGGPARTRAGGAPGERITDFGRQVHARPAVVYAPRTAAQAADAVVEATASGQVVVPRGRGHSVDGQTVVEGSALLDLSRSRAVHEVTPVEVTVDAGATWRDVLAATLPRGLAPVVVPDFLDLTVGGTVSVGGISGISHRYGTAADHVRRAVVVGADGVPLDLGRGDPLLDRVLTGQGRYGVLVTVTLALREVPGRVRRSDIVTGTLADHVDVQRRLLDTGAVHWLEGTAVRGPDGALSWTTRLAQPEDLDASALMMDRTRGWSDFPDFLERADRVVRGEQEAGRWARDAHPRLQTILPLEEGRRVVDELLARAPAEPLGPGGAIMVYVTLADALRRLAVRGDAGGHALVVGWQRTAPCGDEAALARMQEANRRVAALTAEVGGVLYGAGRAVGADGSWPRGTSGELPGGGAVRGSTDAR